MSVEGVIIPGGWTALVVEDESIIAFDLEMRLIALGAARVEVARNEAEALELLRIFTPTVAVVDWFLRRSTSAGCIAALSSVDTEIVVVTGVDRAMIEQTLGPSVTVVTKPVPDRLLASILAAAVVRATTRRPESPPAEEPS